MAANEQNANGFNWLHFSDIHVGVSGQNALWPRFGAILPDDILSLIDKNGPVDLIVFSGDLAQKGSMDEYENFDHIIHDIIKRIATIQEAPQIISVPGNHDVARPSSLSPHAIALSQYWNNAELRENLWVEKGKDFRAFIEQTFESYSNWMERAIESGVHVAPYRRGPLPGDASYHLTTGAGNVGIVGLNSTWLQLSGSDYLAQLHVDVHQLHAVTDGNPDQFAFSNDINLLVTHHPSAWLHESTPATWNNDVNPAGRFDLHLYGHMHEPLTTTSAQGGSLTRQEVQAASLFGLEKYGDGKYDRVQGYSLNRLRTDGRNRTLTSWPRRLISLSGGKMKLVRDDKQDLDETTGAFCLKYIVDRQSHGFPKDSEVDPPLRQSRVELKPPTSFSLDSIKNQLEEAKEHLYVRRVEQEACLTALRENHTVWLSADFGMGQEGFLYSVSSQLSVPNDKSFRIDLSDYTDRSSFLEKLREVHGATIQQFCESLAEIGPSILLLDHVPINISPAQDNSIVFDVLGLGKAIADFASETYVIISSHKHPRIDKFPIVELKALDEPDVSSFARHSELGGERYGKPDAASKLFRHTDGIPTRLDSALRDLEYISLDDLFSANADLGVPVEMQEERPVTLVTAVEELRRSEDRTQQRAFTLLLALSALPQGEQISRIARFLGVHPFGAMHARELQERSLIDVVTHTSLQTDSVNTSSKSLVVPRMIREYVREIVDELDLITIDRKAIDMYFGEAWSQGDIIHSPSGRRLSSPICEGYEISNLSTLILRVTRRAIEEANKLDIEKYLRLGAAFSKLLIKGDHYRSAAGFCEDILRLLDNSVGFEREINNFRYDFARSSRMTGSSQKVTESFESLDHSFMSREQIQEAEVELALCYERLGRIPEAKDAAKRALLIDRNSHAGLHAKVIIAQATDDLDQRNEELKRLLKVAHQKGSHTVANNIMLDLARDAVRQGDSGEEWLRRILNGPKTKYDFYNRARAIINYAKPTGVAERLTSDEKDRLIETYHFLYNERLFNLFNSCHSVLWRVFETSGDFVNLLNLFRHSSFIWRLNNREDLEKEYLEKLAKNMSNIFRSGLAQGTRDGRYFAVRISLLLGVAPSATG